MALKIKVTLTRSTANRPKKHRETVKGLGLSRPGKSRVLEDTPAIRGMIRAIPHMVAIEPVE